MPSDPLKVDRAEMVEQLITDLRERLYAAEELDVDAVAGDIVDAAGNRTGRSNGSATIVIRINGGAKDTPQQS